MRDRIAYAWAAVALAAHLAVAGRYGLFRDELYFIECGRHPAFGYVDQPPLVPLLAAGTYALGHQLWMVRLIPALASAALVLAAVAFARCFGAKDGAAHLTGATVATAPMFLALHSLFDTTVFDPLAWTLVALLFARAARGDGRAPLLWAGVVAGVALEAKYAIVVWLVALVAGCALTPARAVFTRRDFSAGLVAAVAIAAPSVIWQALHGWPFAELVHAAGRKNVHVSPPDFALRQILVMNPLAAPVWIAGIAAPFVRRDLDAARPYAIAFAIAVVATALGGGKDYYVAAAYPVAFALGAIAIERSVARRARVAYAAAVVATAAILAPTALPVLPPALVRPYLVAVHAAPVATEHDALGLLPQQFADQFGWQDLADTVARAYRALPPRDRARARVLAGNYGEAAAIDVLDDGRELPPTLSGHNQYYLWGPRRYDGAVLLDVGGTVTDDRRFCRSAELVATAPAEAYAMPYESGLGIVLCRDLKMPVAALWPKQKSYH